MILLKKRILKSSALCICFFLSFSINLNAQEDPGMEKKLEERRLRHQNLQNPNLSVGLKDSLSMIFNLQDELDQLVSKDDKLKDIVDLFLIDHQEKISMLCPTLPIEKLYQFDTQVVSTWIQANPNEVEGYIQLLNAVISNIQNN